MAGSIRVACLIDDEFEDSEFRVPYDRLKRAGADVELIGFQAGKDLTGHKGDECVRVERAIDTSDPTNYQALFIPGGYSPDHLRADERFLDFVRAFDQQKKPIAAICHGAQLLLSAGLVEGRTLTAWKTVQRDLAMAGAYVRDEPVVRDRNWITSREPGDLEPFCGALVDAVFGETTRQAPSPP